MKDDNVKTEEETEVLNAQKALEEAKTAMRAARQAMRKIGKINRDAGRAEAANACLRFGGVLRECAGLLDQGHADASDALLRNWPEQGGPIVLGGGGGR